MKYSKYILDVTLDRRDIIELDDELRIICINQHLQTSSDTSEDTSLGVEIQTNMTPEEIMLSELQVGKHIISHIKMIFNML